MKYYILLSMLLFSGNLYAQQAKAYELVHYVATNGGQAYLLDYADGYPCASNIKIKRAGRTTFILEPVNGFANDNGDLLFIAPKSKQEGEIVLHGVDDDNVAPAKLKATYKLKGRKLVLTFKKTR